MSADKPCSLSLFQIVRDNFGNELSVLACTKATLIQLSHTLEELVLNQQMPALLFTGFQDAANWHPAAARYHELAATAQQVVVFAGGDLPQESQPNAIHVALHPADPLCREWFMVVVAPQFSAVLCGKERTPTTDDDYARPFDTLWSFNPVIIGNVLDLLEEVIATYRPDRQAAMQRARQQFPLAAPDLALITLFTIEMIRFEETLHERLRATTSALHTQLRWRDDLVTTLVHDMRAPLSHLMLALDLLELPPPQDTNDAINPLAVARRSTLNLRAMIQLILDTNQLDAGHLELRWQLNLPQLLLDQALEALDTARAAAQVRLTTYIDARATHVWGDASLLSRVIQNLVSNAIKFTQPGGLVDIAISLAPSGEMVELRVHDTGRGIDAHQMAHIFDRYYQGDGHDQRGNGLGLYFCKLAIEAHYGSIHVATQVDLGTTFTISLPVQPPQ